MKNLIKSKTFWTGVATLIYGASLLANGSQETGVQTILAGLGMIFVKHAIDKK